MPTFPHSKAAKLIGSASLLFCALSHAQRTPPAGPLPQASSASLHDTLLAKATSLYYSTAKAGLRNFDCQVHPDWARMMKSARKGAALPVDDPKLALLNTVTVTLHADLKVGASLDWKLPEHPEKPLDDSQTAILNQVHHGVEQSLGGVIKMWAPLVNGSIAETLGEESAEITEDSKGYTVRSNGKLESLREVFDPSLVLEEFEVVSSTSSNVNLKPVFQANPQGLLPTSFSADIRDPGAPPQSTPQQMSVALEYQAVSGMQVPARITIVMPNVVEMDFKLDGCTVNSR